MTKKLEDDELKNVHHTFQRGETVRLYRKDVALPELLVGDRLIIKNSYNNPAAFIGVGLLHGNPHRTLWVRISCLAHVKP